MSIEAMTQVWGTETDFLSLTQRYVTLAIADTVNDAYDNRFFMAVPKLAAKAGVAENTVRATLRQLVEAGWMEVVTESKGRAPSEYRWLGNPANAGGLAETNPSTGEGTTLQAVRGNPSDDGSDTSLCNPSNPKGEPKPLDAQFEACWAHYPRKVEKRKAQKCWMTRVKRGADPDDLLKATINYAELLAIDEGRPAKHASTFWGPNEPWRDWVDGIPASELPRQRRTRRQKGRDELMEKLADAMERESLDTGPRELTGG